jgi:hypothetical protein
MKMKRTISNGADIQMDSYKDQRQFFAVTANPLRRGPREAVMELAGESP